MSAAPAASSIQANWRESFFNAPDGTKLFHASLVPATAKGAVLIVHGYDDHALRYKHVMQALAEAGYAAHAFDYRGHGQAGGKRGFAAQFSDFTSDLRAFIQRVAAESSGVPMFILAHSHGALVSGSLLLDSAAPKEIHGAIFSSPYYQLRIAPSAFQLFQARVVGKLIPFLPVKSPLSAKMLSRDPAMVAEAEKDPLKHRIVTPRWFTVSNEAQAALLGSAAQFKLPLLMLQGAEDGIAHPDGGKRFFDAAGSRDKRYVSYPGMLHEVLHELEREKPIGEMISWLDAHVNGKANQ